MAHGGGGVPFKDQPWYKRIFLLWTHEGAHYVSEDVIYGWSFEPLVVIPLAFLVLLAFLGAVDPAAVSGTLAMVVALSPIWLPIGLAIFFWITWMHYIRYMFWFKQEFVLLEIQLPPEVEKSPLSMELFLTAMYNSGGESTFIARIWKGQFRAIFTLEIASNEGQIKFYLHCRKAWKNVLEARLYGQFPEARVTEVPDYVAPIPYNDGAYSLWGAEFAKTAKVGGHPVDAMPIKTYIDYALDKSPDKPEMQTDPISNLVEFLGQIGQGEYVWMQIIMRARKKDEWYGFYTSGDPWKKPAQDKINELTNQAIKRAQGFIGGEGDDAKKEKEKVGSRGAMLLTGGEKLQVEAIERNLTKNVFECGIRVMYLARNEDFKGINIGQVVKFFDAYRQENYNNIMPTRGNSDFDYPWQDWNGIRENRVRRNLFFRYKHRAYFFVPYDQVPTLLTTEELATIWHFPSSVVQTPALDRVPSRRSEAPINLPT
jgi:hypothetical protein